MNESIAENVETSGQIIGQGMDASVASSIQFHDSNVNSEGSRNILPISGNLILTETTDMSNMQTTSTLADIQQQQQQQQQGTDNLGNNPNMSSHVKLEIEN